MNRLKKAMENIFQLKKVGKLYYIQRGVWDTFLITDLHFISEIEFSHDMDFK